MSSSKYDKIGNYNLSYELLLEAVEEFDGYVLGLSQNDIWLFAENILESEGLTRPKIEAVDANLKKMLTKIMPRVLDRTTGTYFFSDLVKAENTSTLKPHISDYTSSEAQSMLTFIPGYFSQGLSSQSNVFVGAMRGFDGTAGSAAALVLQSGVDFDTASKAQEEALQYFAGSGATVGYRSIDGGKTYDVYLLSDPPPKLQTINDCLYHYDVMGLEKKAVQKDVKDEKTGEIKKETIYLDEDKKEPKMFSADVLVDSSFLNAPEINKQTSGIPDRYISPSLGAIVVQHPKASNAGKGKDHLPIFFNAIPAIEMSRCVPYIDVRVLTENYNIDGDGNKTAPSKLNSAAYMRYTKGENGSYVLDDAEGFGDLSPVSKSVRDDEREALKNVDVAYMDIFTSPQTFSNANINASNPTANSDGGGLFLSAISGQINDDPILEPIMPFLSLESLNISITGAGYGIMASKKGSLKLTLHDRSRLKDLAPLVSSSQFATTRILIEYGWNHPEGGPGSDNVIGKYLNSLKERSVYQVVKCDYDFSDGGAVGINIGLAAYGFRQTERVHCGAGPEIPLNVFSEYFESVSEDLIKNNAKTNKANKEKAKEVRQKIKLNERSSRSTSNSLSWAAYREIMGALRSGDEEAKDALKYIFELEAITDSEEKLAAKTRVEQQLNIIFNDDKTVETSTTGGKIFTQLDEAGLFQENTKETMLQRMYGKIKAMENPDISDPFISSLVYKSKIQEKTLAYDDLLGDFLTSTPGVQKAAFGKNEGIEKAGNPFTSYVTLGKAIANFIGYPMAATCLYDEVQMIFYPLNHHSGGGRVHTTASLPIPISRIREEVQDAVKTSSNVSVKRMFALLERIVKDKNSPVYNISDITNAKKDADFNALSENDQLGIVLEICCGPGGGGLDFDLNDDTNKEIFKNYSENERINYTNARSLKEGAFSTKKNGGVLRQRLNKLLNEYKKQKNQKIKADLADRLTTIYSGDGLATNFPGLDRFIRPNISMDFEVIDAIRASEPGSEIGYKERFKQEIFSPKDVDSGLHENKSILRIHIYDEETVMSPAEHTLLSTITEGTTGTPITGEDNTGVIAIAENLNFNQAKQYIKRTYPTIIYGAAGSTVRNLSVSANTSGQMANILMVESYGNLKQAQVGGINAETNFESVTMFPNTVSCTLMGMPNIGRGNTIFIDFGTNTSLDNIYTVKNVTHTIRAGDFSTTLDLVPSNMGAVEGFAKNIAKMVSK